jgi:hypothetical protein
VFALALVVYGLSPNVTNYDSYLSFPTAVSLVHSGDLDLDEFSAPLVTGHYGNVAANGHHFDAYPWPVSLLFVPLVVGLDMAQHLGLNPGAQAAVDRNSMGPYQLAMASFVSALAAGLVTHLAERRSTLRGRRRALVAVAIGLGFAFGTSSWSTASRALWQHGPSMVLIALGLILAQRALSRSAAGSSTKVDVGALGLVTGLSYIVRPTNAIVVAAFAGWVLFRQRRHLLAFVAGGGLIAVPWAIVNELSFGSLLPQYHRAGRLALHKTYGEAVLANLVSPSRGLVIFAPVVLVAAAGVVCKVRTRTLDSLDVLAVTVVLAYVLVVSASNEAWWAGHSVGPRFLTDPLPIIALLAVPAVDALVGDAAHPVRPSRRRRAATALLLVALTWSVAVNAEAATMRVTNCWNADPTDINADPGRVWSMRRPQVVLGFITLVERGPRVAVKGTC